MTNRRQTQAARRRYNRIAPVYDALEAIVERVAFSRWRRILWSRIEGKQLLEVGIGTGKNLAYHPEGVRVTAIDLSDRMMKRARHRATRGEVEVDLALGDAQLLPFATDVFDAALATFVFCSVPDPVLGLQEVRRVVRQGGQVLLLEHVRVDVFGIGTLMDFLDPIVVRIMGPHIARRTVANVSRAGLRIEEVQVLAPGGLVKSIHARVI